MSKNTNTIKDLIVQYFEPSNKETSGEFKSINELTIFFERIDKKKRLDRKDLIVALKELGFSRCMSRTKDNIKPRKGYFMNPKKIIVVDEEKINKNELVKQVKELSTKPMNAKQYLESKYFENRIVNKEDLPEYWTTLSDLMESYHSFKNQSNNG